MFLKYLRKGPQYHAQIYKTSCNLSVSLWGPSSSKGGTFNIKKKSQMINSGIMFWVHLNASSGICTLNCADNDTV